ncbi:protocatechuate 3,4-dioxygenase subunit alpha [Leptolyngbya sp. 15MV]|nr:protocatechuate 3,4-dioxygenase subunit alpha [Leptolyngbya sp. 15MV]
MTHATTSQTAGPYWHMIDFPEWADLLRVGSGNEEIAGETITLIGRVTDGDGAAVSDALVEIWQAGPDGSYEGAFHGFGRCATDAEGQFRFTTLKPGPVPGRGNTLQAPHIQIAIFARGLMHHVVTRAYFEGEALNATDPVLNMVEDPARRATLVAKNTGGGVWRMDVRLQGDGETVFRTVSPSRPCSQAGPRGGMIGDETSARTLVAQHGDAAGIARLELLLARLTEENARQNLVAAATLPIVWQRHFADSAQLLVHVSRGTAPWLDLGSGAGFPGLVIAALRPDDEVILVESRRKRINWLERMRAELGLTRCRIEGRRLELVETVPVAAITARAFAPLRDILDLSARFSTARTRYLLPKGRSAAQELTEMPKWIRRTFHVEQSLTDPEAGIVVGQLDKEARARL